MRYLPINELGFNIILRVLITIYGITGIGNLMAYTPDPKVDDDDEVFKLSKTSYIFRLLTSLLFLLFGISEFKNQTLIYLTIIEIIIIIIAYTHLLVVRYDQSKKQIKRIKEQNKYRRDQINKGY